MKIFIYIKVSSPLKGVPVTITQLLTLDTLAPLTPGKRGPVGRWTSDSPYLGKTRSGEYYVSDLYSPGAVPYGAFFDSLSTPFMRLDNFLPLKLAKEGWGILIRTQQPGVEDQGIKWSKDKT
jgi:hypothetical protein